jgi:hypothetical protein
MSRHWIPVAKRTVLLWAAGLGLFATGSCLPDQWLANYEATLQSWYNWEIVNQLSGMFLGLFSGR